MCMILAVKQKKEEIQWSPWAKSAKKSPWHCIHIPAGRAETVEGRDFCINKFFLQKQNTLAEKLSPTRQYVAALTKSCTCDMKLQEFSRRPPAAVPAGLGWSAIPGPAGCTGLGFCGLICRIVLLGQAYLPQSTAGSLKMAPQHATFNTNNRRSSRSK